MPTDRGTTETGPHAIGVPVIAADQQPADAHMVGAPVLGHFGPRPFQLPDEPVCVVPTCTTGVDDWGQVCDECLEVFGEHLQPTDRPALTREDIAARDSNTSNAYALQRMLRGAQTTPARGTRLGARR